MKALKVSITTMAMALASLTAFSQTKFTEGVLTYDISVKGSSQIPAGLENARMIVYLTEDASRRESISGPGTESTVYNNKTGKGFILKEFSGQKLLITMTESDWNLLNRKNNEAEFSFSDKTISIGGRQCKTATGKYADGKSVVVYYDPSVQIVNNNFQNSFPQVPGLPVQFELQSGNLSFVYTLKEALQQNIINSKFEMPGGGYRVMSFEESQQLKKGSN